MKKKKRIKYHNIFLLISIVVFIGVGLFLLITNSNDIMDIIDSKMICILKNETNDDNYTSDTKFIINNKKNIVTTTEINIIIKSKNNTILAYYEDFYKKQYNDYNKNYGGYLVNTNIENGKVSINATLDYSKVNIKKYLKENKEIKSYFNKNNKLTIKNAKKYYESLGATCK